MCISIIQYLLYCLCRFSIINLTRFRVYSEYDQHNVFGKTLLEFKGYMAYSHHLDPIVVTDGSSNNGYEAFLAKRNSHAFANIQVRQCNG